MKVSPSEPFQIVYSLLEHEYLGYLVDVFAVQLDARLAPTLLYQTLSPQNIGEFAAALDDRDYELVKLIEASRQDAVLRKFNTRKLPVLDFFLRVYDPQKGDKLLQETICGYLEGIKARLFPLVAGKHLHQMGNDGNPVGEPVQWVTEPARVFFNFVRNPDATHYFPVIRIGGRKLDWQQRNARVLVDEPAWLLVEGRLYHFSHDVDGRKLRPFLQKPHIIIPKNIEDQYYRKFVAPLIATYDVDAQGFEIRFEDLSPRPVLTFSESGNTSAAAEPKLVFELQFQYGHFLFRYHDDAHDANVSVEHTDNDDYVFYKIRRDEAAERQQLARLCSAGLALAGGVAHLPRDDAFAFLQEQGQELEQAGWLLRQHTADRRRYFMGVPTIQVAIHEGHDWFDIFARVQFGEFEIPFLKLRAHIVARKREFTLPNGEIAVIPEAWFTQYSDLLGLAEQTGLDDESGRLVLRKHHVALVQDLERGSLATTVMSRRLARLREFNTIDEQPLPDGFAGTLRPYQQAGFNWLYFLNQYRFGGCLADDMGLGKTVMTLALLQSRQHVAADVKRPSLLVMPTSLLYNWELEARRFTPDLRVFTYTGTYREKNTTQFDDYDVVLTSYGIVRIDIELLSTYRFDYVILDESQAIKNPSSHITKAVMQLDAAHRLILTGTPLENSTMDLWSQMTFINPGLLGSQTFFRNEFQVPIEKRNDEAKTARLYALIKPFMLRRNKAQVATDLPAKVENIHFSEMTPEQEEQYEEAKSYYRNLILERIEEDGLAKSQMIVLQGLTKLRQIANHPRMIDAEYAGDSGKLTDVLMRLESAMNEHHKVLVFSQFIKHLNVVRQYLNERGIRYAYLDGSTTDRQTQVQLFQTDPTVKLFLISLKAGGLGHNLTAADYVFILDPWWNPAIEAQAVDRAHRIGQQKPVFTYKFITKNTVEEKILALQRSKQQLARELITSEDGFVKSLTKEDVMALLA